MSCTLAYVSSPPSAGPRQHPPPTTLPLADRALLAGLGYKDKLAASDRAIITKAEIFGHDLELDGTHRQDDEEQQQPPHADLNHNVGALRHEWVSEREVQRGSGSGTGAASMRVESTSVCWSR
ncbi:hypothetical protein A0H81_06971 [Grifola frondosa]|uniref:Uncharacterized protein n=1 Tax=Grifola frondosa TaxID=5627 RepID=A0A1C7MA12_GRIFR|nr:hypothetical protein A0H81_06971 [Grifola frondosa]